MSENWGSPAEPESRKVEKERSGILAPLGALLGGLLGAVVWTAVSMLGYITALVGFLIAWLASKGYDLLGGKPGAVKVISLIVSVVIAVAAGTLGNVVYTTHKAYGEARQEILNEYMGYGMTEETASLFILTESETFQNYVQELLNPENEDLDEVRTSILKDFLMGLFFAALGCYGIILSSTKKAAKQQEEAAKQTPQANPFAQTPGNTSNHSKPPFSNDSTGQ